MQIIEAAQQSPGFAFHVGRPLCAMHCHDGPVAGSRKRHLNLIGILAVVPDLRANAERFSKALAKGGLVRVFESLGGQDDRGLRDPWLTQAKIVVSWLSP
jgi:hypothetical protein